MSVTDTIDKAILDWETSPDAMRWSPAGAPDNPVPRLSFRIDTDAIVESFRQFGVELSKLARDLRRIAAQADEARHVKPPRRPEHIRRMHAAYRAKGRKR